MSFVFCGMSECVECSVGVLEGWRVSECIVCTVGVLEGVRMSCVFCRCVVGCWNVLCVL